MGMGQENRIWGIGALGLTESEIKVLGSMAALTRARAAGSYQVSANPDTADIVIVNADDYNAVVKWRTLAVNPHPPVMVLYTEEPPADPAQRYMLRPFGPAKLLVLLDVIAGQLCESAEVWKKSAVAQPAISNTPSIQRRALVIDDSLTVHNQLKVELRNFNIHADCVETGEDGLHLLSQSPYDLIFLDVILPGSDGYQVCRRIRKDPRIKHTPVIMLTSKSSPFDRVRGSLVGCSTYLTKPVDYNIFRQVVGEYIERGALSFGNSAPVTAN